MPDEADGKGATAQVLREAAAAYQGVQSGQLEPVQAVLAEWRGEAQTGAQDQKDASGYKAAQAGQSAE